MASADGWSNDFDKELWNEVCEDVDCDDTNYHATVDELMQRIRDAYSDSDAIDEAEDIVLQAELKNFEENE